MYDTHETLPSAIRKIEARFASPDFSEPLKKWAIEQLEPIQSDIDLIQRGDDGFEDFLLTFVTREEARCLVNTAFTQADEYRERIPYDTVRERPLCTCDDRGCELKAGRLPLTIRNAADIETGIRTFKQDHVGDPLVLDHDGAPRGARQAFSAKRAAVWTTVRTVKTYMTKDRDQPPERIDIDTEATHLHAAQP